MNNSRQQKQFKVILIGDVCIDEYQYGNATRLSPEAPIPIFTPTYFEKQNGMAYNVENNLKKFGIQVTSYFGKPSIKTRLIHEKSKHHMIRIDKDVLSDPLSKDTIFPNEIDAFVISDYNKGFVTYELINKIEEEYGDKVPIFIDTKKPNLCFFKKSILKINELEFNSRTSDNINMIVTRGSKSVLYKGKEYSVPKVPVFDVCGAGDTFLSSLTYKFLMTKNMDESIKFAIRASCITIQHLGVYAPSLEEIL